MRTGLVMIAGNTISGIIRQYPDAEGVLSRYDIDFTVNAEMKLKDVCKGDALMLFEIIRDLHRLKAHSLKEESLEDRSLTELCELIVSRHHSYVKSTLPAIVVHGYQVAKQYGQLYPFLEEVKKILTLIRVDFSHHMMKEEEFLFPAVAELERIRNQGTVPEMNLKMIVDPLKVILKDHTHAEGWFSEIRRLTDNFSCPEDADNLFLLFYQELQAFEDDLHEHVYLENEVLFPRLKQLLKKTGN